MAEITDSMILGMGFMDPRSSQAALDFANRKMKIMHAKLRLEFNKKNRTISVSTISTEDVITATTK